MKELDNLEIRDVNGGMAFFIYFAAAYAGTFAASAGFAYGAVDAMSQKR